MKCNIPKKKKPSKKKIEKSLSEWAEKHKIDEKEVENALNDIEEQLKEIKKD